MKISVGKENLKWATDVCAKVVNLKSPRDELRCVRIEAKNGKTFVHATNLEEWVAIPLDGAKIETEGACIVNLAELKLFVKDAQPKKFIEIESDGTSVKAATDINGNSIAKGIKAANIEDWPEFPKAPSQMQKTTPDFLNTIMEVAPSSSSKDFRRALACVYVNEGLAVSTDGHHLVALPCNTPFGENFLIKPTKLLESGYLNGECKVGLDLPEKGKGGKLTVVTDSLTWTTTLSDADYPSWRNVVPAEANMLLSVQFNDKSAKEFLRAIPALKSNEGAIGLSCRKDVVLAGSSCTMAAFKTDAVFSGTKQFDIELSAANLSRALELGLYELKMTDAVSPVLFKDGRGAFMASMPLRQKQITNQIPKEEVTMTKQNVQESQPTTATHGLTMSKPQTQTQAAQVDPFEELIKSAEEAKTAARSSYDAAAQFARKLHEVQGSLKRKEREQKATKELIEKLKIASGF